MTIWVWTKHEKCVIIRLGEDIMSLFDKLFKRSQEQKIEEIKDTNVEQPKMVEVEHKDIPTIFQKYPKGLPIDVLETIDYSKFGAMLKQEKLLPPSYDRKPASVEIKMLGDFPTVKLTFKSKTSPSHCSLAIYEYNVFMAKQDSKRYHINHTFSGKWVIFCEKIMWLKEKGYASHIVNDTVNKFTLTDDGKINNK